MQFNVAQLLLESIGSTRLYDLVEEIDNLDPDLAILGPLVGRIQLMRIHSGVLVTGELGTAIQATCNRCLHPLVMPVRFQIEESFRPLTEVSTGRYFRPDEYEGEAEDLEDEALVIDEHHMLNLSEIVRQDIWLALPIVSGCNWEGPAPCPNLVEYMSELKGLESGATSSGKTEETETIDPRWAALLRLRGELDDTD